MAKDEKLYSIAEVAKRCGVTLRTLRFYEQKKLIEPHRATGGSRLYTILNLEQIEAIIRVKNYGFTLMEIREMISRSKNGVAEPSKKQIANQVAHLTRTRDDLDNAIKILLSQPESTSQHAGVPTRPN